MKNTDEETEAERRYRQHIEDIRDQYQGSTDFRRERLRVVAKETAKFYEELRATDIPEGIAVQIAAAYAHLAAQPRFTPGQFAAVVMPMSPAL